MSMPTTAEARDRLAMGFALDHLWGETVGLADGEGFLGKLRQGLEKRLESETPPAVVEALLTLTGKDVGADLSGRLATLVATRLGTDINAYRTDALKTWIAGQQRLGRRWDEVSAAGTALVEGLYPDRLVRSEVLANVRLVLVDPALIQAQLQKLMIPWQEELDGKIEKVREAGEAVLQRLPEGATPVQVALAKVEYIEVSRHNLSITPGGLLVTGDCEERISMGRPVITDPHQQGIGRAPGGVKCYCRSDADIPGDGVNDERQSRIAIDQGVPSRIFVGISRRDSTNHRSTDAVLGDLKRLV